MRPDPRGAHHRRAGRRVARVRGEPAHDPDLLRRRPLSLQHAHDLDDDTPLAPRAERFAAALALAAASARSIADDDLGAAEPAPPAGLDVLDARELEALARAVGVSAEPLRLAAVAREVEAWARHGAGDLFGNVDLFELALFTLDAVVRRAAGGAGTVRLAAAATVASLRLSGFALGLDPAALADFVRGVASGALDPLEARERLRGASRSV